MTTDPTNYDGQGKTMEQETHGAMVAVVIALGASLAFFTILGIALWAILA